MKRLILSLAAISILSGAAAFVTWKIVGPPDRSVECDPGDLPAHHVCFSTVRGWNPEEILWVDARLRENWKEDGVAGSILVNDQENWDDLEEQFVMTIFGDGSGTRNKVVVYCNQLGCSSSTYVADRLRERHGETLGFETYVLHGGVKALKSESR
ncbi:MAG: rhodanese-like domain-containing protein [Akkermansiaceae bacterium]|jgi:rhodanese-related sulfurtransferase